MKKFLNSFLYAFNGVLYAFKTQLNFRLECIGALTVILMGYYLDLDKGEWLWITLSIVLVLILELLNTAIETIVDLLSPQYNPKAGAIKDLASAAVLIGSAFSIVVALIILVPKLMVCFTN